MARSLILRGQIPLTWGVLLLQEIPTWHCLVKHSLFWLSPHASWQPLATLSILGTWSTSPDMSSAAYLIFLNFNAWRLPSLVRSTRSLPTLKSRKTPLHSWLAEMVEQVIMLGFWLMYCANCYQVQPVHLRTTRRRCFISLLVVGVPLQCLPDCVWVCKAFKLVIPIMFTLYLYSLLILVPVGTRFNTNMNLSWLDKLLSPFCQAVLDGSCAWVGYTCNRYSAQKGVSVGFNLLWVIVLGTPN